MPRQTAAAEVHANLHAGAVNPCAASVDRLLTLLELAEPSTARIGVAYSGGADSTALLHTLIGRLPGRVKAIHIHHGLQAAADQFESHCLAECERLHVSLTVVHIKAEAAARESPEDAARKARYAALARTSQQLGLRGVALAQHADDQAETLLLALTRGAGLPGLAAMPAAFERHGVSFFRPLLNVTSSAIRQWLEQANIDHVEDPSNTNESLTRNRIRRQILPALAENFPEFRAQFARTARHAAQGKRLLEDLARLDMDQIGTPPRIAALQALPLDRQANALRYWLKNSHHTSPSDAQLQELVKQIGACVSRAHRIQIKIGTGRVERVGDVLKSQENCHD